MLEIIDADDFPQEHNMNGKIVYVLDDQNMTIGAYFFGNLDGLTTEQLTSISEEEMMGDDDLLQQEIGHISVKSGWLEHIHVNEAFQRRGIGLHLVKLAIEHVFMAFVAAVQFNTQYTRGLTPAGEHLIAACIDQDIIPGWACSLSAESLEEQAQLANYDHGNPIIASAIVKAALREKYPGDFLSSDEEEDDETEDDMSISSTPSAPYRRTIGSVSTTLPVSVVSDDDEELPRTTTNRSNLR